jgi:hypothetical protein
MERNGKGYTLFYQKRPATIKVGDVLIVKAIGNGRIVGYYKVISKPFRDEEFEEKYTWCLKVELLSFVYTKSWRSSHLMLTELIENFKTAFAGVALTNTGRFTLGTLNFGSNKIQITQEFAGYLLYQIDNYI